MITRGLKLRTTPNDSRTHPDAKVPVDLVPVVHAQGVAVLTAAAHCNVRDDWRTHKRAQLGLHALLRLLQTLEPVCCDGRVRRSQKGDGQ